MEWMDSPRYAPPGHDNLRLQGLFLWTMIILVGWALTFFFRLGDTIATLNNGYPAWAETDFAALMAWRLTPLPIGVLLMGVMAAVNYSRFYQGSKSIYLMRRLPDKWELHRRCLTAPLLCCGIYVVTAVVLFVLCVAAYRFCMPQEYLPEDWVESVVRSVTTLQIFGV